METLSSSEEDNFFVVVDFGIGPRVISKAWMRGNNCVYPIHLGSEKKIRKAIEQDAIPNGDWSVLKLLRTFGTYDSMTKAEVKAKMAIAMSETDSEDEKSKRKSWMKRINPSSDSDETYQKEEKRSKRLELVDLQNNLTTSRQSITQNTVTQLQVEMRNMKKEMKKLADTNEILLETLHKVSQDILAVKYNVRQVKNNTDLMIDKETQLMTTQPASLEYAMKVFPMATEADLIQVEEILRKNCSERDELIRYVQSIGGSTADKAVKLILCQLFKNELAAQYSWEGRKRKQPLRDLGIMKLIFDTVLQKNADSDRAMIQKRIMEWFRHAKGRTERALHRNKPCKKEEDIST